MNTICRIGLCAALLSVSGLAAQERRTNFRELSSEWSKLDGEIRQVENEIRGAQSRQQIDTLRKTYDQLVAGQFQLFSKLQTAAEQEYVQAPNQSEEVTRTLVGMLKDLVRRDQYDSAWRLAELLYKNDCPDTSVANFGGIAAYGRDDFENAERLLRQAEKQGVLSQDGQRCLADVEQAQRLWVAEARVRDREEADNNLPRVQFTTTKGVIAIELFENEAPEAVGNFVSLVEKKFYDGLSFHRVLNNFMAQGGCPTGDGRGNPGYRIRCECYQPNHRKHFSGALSMAHAGRDTGGSQFFLTFRRTPHLDGKHTVFGRVIEGYDVLTSLQRREPPTQPGAPGIAPDKILKAEVLRKRDHVYEPVRVQ